MEGQIIPADDIANAVVGDKLNEDGKLITVTNVKEDSGYKIIVVTG